MSIRLQALSFLKEALKEVSPPLRLVFWDGETFDFVDQPTVVVALGSSRLLKDMLRGDFSSLGDAYVRGELTVEGCPQEIIKVGVTLCERLEKAPAAGLLRTLGRLSLTGRSINRDAENVRRHYDVSNEFYGLWLDKRLVYSCAYFQDENDDIDRAQEQKLEHLCRKLMLQPGDRLLDVGCGWGALLQWAAERYGATGYGITLSERQFDEAKKRLSHLRGKADVALKHYRELGGDASFDRIVSVGMYEHVGSAALRDYFKKMAALLAPGGVFLNHGVIAAGEGKSGPSGGDFIQKYVFPGGAVSSLATIVKEVTSAGLEIIDIEDLRPHYARTLHQWSERLERHKERAMEAVEPATYRIWRVYLAGMAYAFERGWLSIAQVVALKPKDGRPSPRPLTRAYQYIPAVARNMR